MLTVKDRKNKKAHEESAQFACEVAGAIRTVASLTREENCSARYSEILRIPLQNSVKTAVWVNLLFAFAQSTTFYVVALLFWYGAKQILAGNMDMRTFFIVIFVSVF